MTEFFRDCLDEAQELKGTIEARQASDNASSRGATQRLLARFRVLQGLLRGQEAKPDVDPLARDIAAQKKGEIPEFIARKLAAERAGTARVIKEATGAADKAARMASDLAGAARGAQMRPRGRR